MQTLSPEVVYKMLVAAALRKSTVTMAQLLSVANDGFPVYVVTNRVRTQINEALCACYWMDAKANRPPLSALFVMEETGLPGNRLRALIEEQRGAAFDSDAEFVEHWQNLCTAIWDAYNVNKSGE